MCPTLRLENPDKPEVIYVPLLFVSSSDELSAVHEALRELKKELIVRWPVKNIHIRKRNPFHPTEWQVTLAIGLATPVLKAVGDKLAQEALTWLRRKCRRKSGTSRKGSKGTRKKRGN